MLFNATCYLCSELLNVNCSKTSLMFYCLKTRDYILVKLLSIYYYCYDINRKSRKYGLITKGRVATHATLCFSLDWLYKQNNLTVVESCFKVMV